MCGIASAQAWGEGDYQEWGEETTKVYDSLRDKVWSLLARRKGPA